MNQEINERVNGVKNIHHIPRNLIKYTTLLKINTILNVILALKRLLN